MQHLLSSVLVPVLFLSAPAFATPGEPVHAVRVEGERAVLVGAGWRAHLGVDGAVFTPALGRAADRNRDLALATTGIDLGGRSLGALDLAARPTDAGGFVAYARGAGVTERWTPSAGGLELSYVFDSLPAERGELVVRVALATDLPLEEQHLDGARFVEAGLGGVSIGAVTGIDANGRTARGDLRVVADSLELSLPSSFVRSAALPLVLDPVVSPVLGVATSLNVKESRSEAAYDATHDRYLVAYQTVFSLLDTDVYGELVDASGAPQVVYIPLEFTASEAGGVSVANHAGQDTFLVAWHQYGAPTGWDIHARQVDPADGSTSPANMLASGAGDQLRPLLGGNLGTSPYALLVFQHDGAEVRSARVNLNAVGGPWIASVQTLTAGASIDNVSMSRSAGPGGRHLVLWDANFLGVGGLTKQALGGAVLSDDNALLYVDSLLDATSWSGQEFRPVVDGDGTDFVVAFLYDEDVWNGPLSGDEVRVQHITWNGSSLIGQATYEVVSDPADADALEVECALVGDQVLIVHLVSDALGDTVARSAALDRETLVRCESLPAAFSGPKPNSYGHSIAAQRATGSEHADGALVTWTSYDYTTVFGDVVGSEVLQQIFRSSTTGGLATDLGGATPFGGRALAPCAYVGNSDFAFELRDVPAAFSGSFALLNGDTGFQFACGGGVLRVDLAGAYVFGVTPTGTGTGSAAVSIPPNPNLAGIEVVLQFTSIVSGGASCQPFGTDLSNALKFPIQ